MSAARDRAESIRRRLRNHLRARGEDVQFGLQRYAIERFLYLLGASPHRSQFVLKGATLFALWGGATYRPTRDMDFTGYGSSDEADVVKAIREICSVPGAPADLVFDPDSVAATPIRDDSEYHGLRVTLIARLERSEIPVQIDIGFGNAIQPPPQEATYPTLLDDPAPSIRAYPPEAVVAEKLHALVVIGERNSRYKDFYDLHVLARQFNFDGARLASAIVATFERRRTATDAALPVGLTPRFYGEAARGEQWRAYLTRNSLPGAPADLTAVGEVLLTFLNPVWAALAAREAFTSSWTDGGPWKTSS